MSHCEDTESETDCFSGCAYGDESGGTYRFLMPQVDHRFTKPRCKLSIHPRCACTNGETQRVLFPPPPPRQFTEEWSIARPAELNSDGTARDTSRGASGALVQRLTNGHTLDLSLRAGPMHVYECPLDNDGSETCALTCSREHLSRLRAFTVTGENLYSPPSPPPPSPAPSSPPVPFEAAPGDRFAACQNTCTGLDENEQFCRDGGQGSFSPARCAYGTQCDKCGPRAEVRSVTVAIEGDDSCAYANDGICKFHAAEPMP